MKDLSRRSFLASTALSSGAASLALPSEACAASTSAKKRIKLGISTCSYWHFKTAKVSIETVIDKAAVIGVEGIDILHRQMDIPEREPIDTAARAYCQKLKRHAFTNGLDLNCLSIHQNFVSPKPEERQKGIDHTLKCIELAYLTGIPSPRK